MPSTGSGTVHSSQQKNKTMKKLLLTITLLFCGMTLFAQSEMPIKGVCLDDRNKVLENVGIYSIDSTLLAIKNNLIPKEITSAEANVIYANEADVLNVALFGKTAKMWKEENPDLEGNIRDYASIEQLIVLINLESMNSELIKTGKSQSERALYLNKMAIEQLTVLYKYDNKFLNEFNSDE